MEIVFLVLEENTPYVGIASKFHHEICVDVCFVIGSFTVL